MASTDAKTSYPSSPVPEILFYKAPWRRRADDKGPLHYLVIGTASATYLFIVGAWLTYLVHFGEEGEWHMGKAMGMPTHFLGPMFLSLGILIIIFSMGLVCFFLGMHLQFRITSRGNLHV